MRFIFPFFLLFCSPVFAQQQQVFEEHQQQGFEDWLSGIKREALNNGISQEVIDDAFADVTELSPEIMELDGKQPENKITFDDYVTGVLTAKRISESKENFHTNKKLLHKIESKYHVPASIIVALWAVESHFGDNQGKFSVINSLTTLAYDGRRSEFFRKQLMDALKILQNENMEAKDLTGSWAGAMGQTQFMPSSYLSYAVDFNHDGKKDIWNSDADALASIANYLHSKGWNPKYGWGIKVSIPDFKTTEEWRLDKAPLPLKEWNRLGFTKENGNHLPRTQLKARLVIPEDGSAAFLVFPNYDVIMDWNHSIYFATSICLLADKIKK